MKMNILKNIDVFGLGQCSLDCLAKIAAYPPPDTKCEFSGMAIQGGGPVATALVALTRWGLSCAFSGVVGDDEWGKTIRDSLNSEGVDTRSLLVRDNCSSQFAFILAEPGTGRRTIFWRRPTGPPPCPAEVPIHLLKKAAVFHTDGLFIEAALAAAATAREAGVTVSVDAGTLREGMLDLARLSDCFVASETFSRALVGGDDPEGACRKLAELGPRIVGVTLGAKGYAGFAEGRLIRNPAYPVEAIDTTGCGDVFHAGFIFGLRRNWPCEKCFDFAAWSAAQVSRRLGGRSGIPTGEEMKERRFI
jgi:ribokinase